MKTKIAVSQIIRNISGLRRSLLEQHKHRAAFGLVDYMQTQPWGRLLTWTELILEEPNFSFH